MRFIEDPVAGITRLVTDGGVVIADYSGVPASYRNIAGCYEARDFTTNSSMPGLMTEGEAREWICSRMHLMLSGLADGGCKLCGRRQPTSGGERGTWRDVCHDCDEQATYAINAPDRAVAHEVVC